MIWIVSMNSKIEFQVRTPEAICFAICLFLEFSWKKKYINKNTKQSSNFLNHYLWQNKQCNPSAKIWNPDTICWTIFFPEKKQTTCSRIIRITYSKNIKMYLSMIWQEYLLLLFINCYYLNLLYRIYNAINIVIYS